jgi:hypothetical protein
MDKKKLRRVPMYIALAAAFPIAIGACSPGSSSTSDPATSAPQAAVGGPSASGTAQSGMAQFAQCMRQNGVTNFPDPSNGHFVMGGNVQSNPHFNTAIQACQHLLGASGIGGSNGAQQSAQLKFAHCMQTSGVPNFPDPRANGAIVAPSGVDRNSATYQAAFNRCKVDLPNGGAGLGG